MNVLSQIIENFRKWVNEPWAVILACAIIGAHWILWRFFPGKEQVAQINQWAGFLTASIGIGILFSGILDRMKQYQIGSISKLLKEWTLRPASFWPKKVIQVTSDITVNVEFGTATATVTPPRVITSTEDQIKCLNEDVDLISKRVSDIKKELETSIKGVIDDSKNATRAIEDRLNELSSAIKDAATGSISYEIFGGILAFYSLVVTSFFELP